MRASQKRKDFEYVGKTWSLPGRQVEEDIYLKLGREAEHTMFEPMLLRYEERREMKLTQRQEAHDIPRYDIQIRLHPVFYGRAVGVCV